MKILEIKCIYQVVSYVVLHCVSAFALIITQDDSLDNLNGFVASAVTTGHVIVHGINGVVKRDISVLSIHIVRATSRVILNPYTVVLHVCRLLLGYLQYSIMR
jgi:predicted secreted protein